MRFIYVDSDGVVTFLCDTGTDNKQLNIKRQGMAEARGNSMTASSEDAAAAASAGW